jgi:antitoxin HicB
MNYHFRVHRAREGGFWAECIELEGCRSQAGSRATLVRNLREALDLYLSEPETSKTVFPRPRRISPRDPNIVAIAPSPSVAFATRLRELRLKRKLTMNEMKTALGIKNLSVYQRLEDPKISNPELKTLARIKRCFPDLKIDDVF